MTGRTFAFDRGPALDVGVGLPAVDRSTLAAPAVLAVGLLFASRLAINARASVPIDLVALQELLVPVSALVTAGSLAAIAMTTPRRDEAVGLAFVAAFGAVGTLADAAVTPAAVALVGGSGLALVGQVQAGHRGRLAVGVLLVAGLAASFTAAIGLVPTAVRPLGTQLALLGIAGTPLSIAQSRVDWGAGVAASAALVALAIVGPFVLGATALVAGGIVGASLPIMALAVGGLTTTASAAIRTRRHPQALGAGLLLFAGVPGTLPRALGFVLAIALLTAPAGGVARAG
ncbi:MAG: phosphate ABC transporter permease [Halorhabdus sp.]